MYFFALIHFAFIKVIFLNNFNDFFPRNTFEITGSIALFILFFLFITSNNLSVRRLRIYWYWIQRLTYLSMFFIFFHVALIDLSIWTIFMGLVIILEVISFIVIYIKTGSLISKK